MQNEEAEKLHKHLCHPTYALSCHENQLKDKKNSNIKYI